MAQRETHPCVTCRAPTRLHREGRTYIIVCKNCGISDFQGVEPVTDMAEAYSLWTTGRTVKANKILESKRVKRKSGGTSD